MQIDWSISLGSIIQIASILGGGFLVLVTMRNTVTVLQRDVGSIQSEIKKMGDVLTKMAVAENRLDNTDTR
jgi:prefoldin subunit 5